MLQDGLPQERAWKEDDKLKADMEIYVGQGLKRTEMLSFFERDFPQYSWSVRSLDRRLRHFGIYYTDRNVTVNDIVDAVKKELVGPGKDLGYRAMHNKIRQKHKLNVPRDVVYAAMYELDPKGLENRGVGFNKKKREKGNFTTRGTNWVHSLDGHAKLMGYQKDVINMNRSRLLIF